MEYFLGKMVYLLPVKIKGKKNNNMNIDGEILQLVKASNKENAVIALRKDFEIQYPEGVIMEIRIMDTIIGK